MMMDKLYSNTDVEEKKSIIDSIFGEFFLVKNTLKKKSFSIFHFLIITA